MSGVDTDEGLGSSSYLRNALDMASPIDVQEDQLFCVCELCGEQMEYRDAMDHAMKHQQVANRRARPLPPPPPYDNRSPGACHGSANNLPTTVTENIRPSSVDSDDSGIVVNGSGSESATTIACAANTAPNAAAPVQASGGQNNATEKGKGAKRSRRSTADKSENGKRKRAGKEPAKSVPNVNNANQMPVQQNQNHAGNYLMPPTSWQSFSTRPAAAPSQRPQQRDYPAIRQCLETTTRMAVREGTTWYPPEHHQPPPSYHYHHPSIAPQHGFQPDPRHRMTPQGAVRRGQHNQFYYPYPVTSGAHPAPAHYTRPVGSHQAAQLAYQANASRPVQSQYAPNSIPNTAQQRQLQSSPRMPRLHPAPVSTHLTHQPSVRNVHHSQTNRSPRPPETVFHSSGGQYQNQQLHRPAVRSDKQSEMATSDENSRQSTSDDCQSPVLPLAEAVYDPSLIYTCEFCSQRFTTALEIRTHTRDDHRILKDYVWCNVCGVKFDVGGGTDHLKNHMESAHGAINVSADVNWW